MQAKQLNLFVNLEFFPCRLNTDVSVVKNWRARHADFTTNLGEQALSPKTTLLFVKSSKTNEKVLKVS